MSNTHKGEKKAAAGKAGGLVGGKATSQAKTEAARINGAKGGQAGAGVTSAAKAEASRSNGAKGGRPKGAPGASEDGRRAALARAAKLTPERRREIALKAVAAREAKRKKL